MKKLSESLVKFQEARYMRLETYPAEDVPPIVADVTPILLHVVRIGKGKRYNHLEPVPTKIHWRQEFEIQGNKVFVINRTSELDVEKDGKRRNVPAKDVVTEMRNNTIILGGSPKHLNLVFLRQKQSTVTPPSPKSSATGWRSATVQPWSSTRSTLWAIRVGST